MRISGVIEGFYGPPWTHAQRLGWIDRLAGFGMTHYVWAAKAEPRHRDRWREPFTDGELAQFADLAARRPSVALAVGLTPGPDATADEVVAKLAPAVSAGASVVVVSCDDIPAIDAGAAHRELAHRLLGDTGAAVWVVPTHYCGSMPSAYLDQLCSDLDPTVEVMWTGELVVNDTITADDARRRRDATGRAPLLWDNVPVNDGLMREALHLGPLAGRDAALRDELAGVLWNPMEFAAASVATLVSAAAWLAGDDPLRAWRAFVDAEGWSHLAAATAFPGEAHWPAHAPDHAPDRAWWAAVAAGLPSTAADVGLDDAVQPWIDAAAEGAAVALDAYGVLDALAERGPGSGVTMRQFALAHRWRAWRRRDTLTYGLGPRIRPLVGQDERGRFVATAEAYGPDESLVGDSLVDQVVRRALRP